MMKEGNFLRNYTLMFLALCAILLASCKDDEWKDHYQQQPETLDAKMWDVIQENPDYSRFVEAVKRSGYDTLLVKSQGFTLFIPTNDAFEGLQFSDEEIKNVIAYHISPTVLTSSNINMQRKLQTMGQKFVLLSKASDGLYLDNQKISNNSPLYKDGTFYELSEVAMPKPNLYEYTSIYSKVLFDYINERRVILLDRGKSKPLGFDDEGNTIYDSVYVSYNFFDLQYFSLTPFEENDIPTDFENFQKWVDQNPGLLSLLQEPYFSINKEYRNNEKTLLIFTQEQYNDAMNVVADNLGDKFSDYNDIPKNWQDEIVIPYFFKVGVFDSSLTYDRFSSGRMKNVLGDSVFFDPANIDASSRFISSNGVTFNYVNLVVPDSLYNDTIWFEGEDLIFNKGENTYGWNEGVTVSTNSQLPIQANDPDARGGKVLQVDFKSSFKDEYWVTFKMPKVFPRNYYFRFSSTWRPSGVIEAYVNGKLLGSVDTYNFRRPVVGAEERVLPQRNINRMSWLVDNITEYGDVEVKLLYKDGGIFKSSNGLIVDYVALVPINE